MDGLDPVKQGIFGTYSPIPDTICTESARHALYAVATGEREVTCLCRTTEQEPFQDVDINQIDYLYNVISKHQKTLLLHQEGVCYVHSKGINNYFFFYQKFW